MLAVKPLECLLRSKRLSEGFHFAYNKTGMINLLLEIDMHVDGEAVVPCVVQYILFPPQSGPSAGKEYVWQRVSRAASRSNRSIVTAQGVVGPRRGSRRRRRAAVGGLRSDHH